MTIKERFEQKGKLLGLLKEAVNAKDFDQTKVDAINDDITQIDRDISALEKANELLSAKTEFKPEEKKAEASFRDKMEGFIRTKGSGEFNMTETRANQFYKGTDGKGGYLVPDEIGDKIVEAQTFVGGMVTPGVCNWISTSTGRKIEIPVVDDTSTKGAVIGEKTDMSSGTDVTYATSDLDFYKITSNIVKVSEELIQDAAFDVVGHVTSLLFQRVYKALNYYFTLGTSGSHPVGIQTLSTKGVDAAKRAITRANIVDLIYSVDRAYRQGAAFQMNDSTVGALRKLYLGSADASPLWQDSMQVGEPMRLEGYPIIVNNDMDDTAAYNQSVFFGDWKRYYVGEALPMKLVRLDELYASTGEVGFNVLGRWAGNLIAYTGDAPIKHIRHAST